MADAGSIWYHSIASFGNDIGDAIQEIDKKNKEWQTVDSFVKMGSQYGIPDPSNPNKTRPLIDPKIVELWSGHSKSEQMRNLGAMEALIKVEEQLAVTGAKARIRADVAQSGNQQRFEQGPITRTDAQGRTWDWNPHTGAWTHVPNAPAPRSARGLTAAQELAQQGREQAHRDKQRTALQKQLSGMGYPDPEGLLDESTIKKGTMVTKGLIHKTPTFQETDKNPTHVQLPSGDIKPMSEFKRAQTLAKQYRDLGKPPKSQAVTDPQMQQAIKILSANPTPKMKQMFEEAFGLPAGTADKVLSQQTPAPTAPADTEDDTDESDPEDEDE